jgi:hypothetical protein
MAKKACLFAFKSRKGEFEMKKIELLAKEKSEKFQVRVKYALIMCEQPGCFSTWGVSPNENNEINEEDLVCRKCAGAYFYKELNK